MCGMQQRCQATPVGATWDDGGVGAGGSRYPSDFALLLPMFDLQP